jgi:hypothetical protein
MRQNEGNRGRIENVVLLIWRAAGGGHIRGLSRIVSS